MKHTILLLAVAGLTASGAAQSYQIPEMPITPLEPLPGFPPQPTELFAGAHTTGASIAPGEVQQWKLFAEEGEQLHFRLRTTTNDLDPVLDVLDSWAQLQFTASCGAPWNGTCSFIYDWVVPATDTFTINVHDNDGFNGGGYVLQLDRVPPKHGHVGLRYLEAHDESLSPVTDTDWIRFDVAAGTIVQINGQTLTNDLDPTLEVRDPAGNVYLADKGCSAPWNGTCTFTIQLDLTVPGTLEGSYALRIRENGIDNTGSLRLTLNCIFGPCGYSSKGLTRSAGSLSLAGGGTSTFALDAGAKYAGKLYLMLGTKSGYLPGFDILGVHVPLTIPDDYFDVTLLRPNQPPLSNSFGTLDGIGRATAAFDVPAGSPPGLAGLNVDHAFFVLDVASGLSVPFASNPVRISLVP